MVFTALRYVFASISIKTLFKVTQPVFLKFLTSICLPMVLYLNFRLKFKKRTLNYAKLIKSNILEKMKPISIILYLWLKT